MKLISSLVEAIKHLMAGLPSIVGGIALLTGSICYGGDFQERTWWKDMPVKVTLLKDSNDAVFAIEVLLTNKSKKDVALFETRARTVDMAHVSILLGEFNPRVLSVSPPPAAILDSGDPLGEPIIARIHPESTLSFCIKSEDFLQGAVPLLNNQASLRFYLFGELAWKRAAGYTTEFGYENRATFGKNRTLYISAREYLDFGQQKFSVHKNRSCTKADASTKK